MKKLNFVLSLLVAIAISGAASARDQIKIVGSSTVYPYATVVAEKFGKSGFKTPVIESTGTGGGMKLFCAGVGTQHPDITNASRAIKSKEKALCAKNGVKDIVEIVVGNDGISFAHSVKAKDMNFTKEQLWRALAHDVDVNGKVVKNPYKKWSDIDKSLPNKGIKILVPPPTSGTRDAWNSLVMGKGCSKAAKAAFTAAGKKAKKACAKLREDGLAVEAGENDTLIVNKLAADPDMFGLFGFSYLVANKDKIKATKVEGKLPSLASIQDYTYPIARPLFFYVKKAHVGTVPGIKEYLKEFTAKGTMGPKGYLTDIGLVPLDSKSYKKTRTAGTKLKTIKLN
ncbi:MAG: phosphate-binding protein [alpha proteobacterium HIMB114]|nr:MAG: phosphate-binding protein [alpha proteobacterium HIMB114]|tara:strand:- start:9294 stop:10316 length:1023 start_codon:yes stop_codon:yes gene_type:complete